VRPACRECAAAADASPLACGGHFHLAAPYDSSNGHDPQFYDKVNQIRRYMARVQAESAAPSE
jgi:hypothetical protein